MPRSFSSFSSSSSSSFSSFSSSSSSFSTGSVAVVLTFAARALAACAASSLLHDSRYSAPLAAFWTLLFSALITVISHFYLVQQQTQRSAQHSRGTQSVFLRWLAAALSGPSDLGDFGKNGDSGNLDDAMIDDNGNSLSFSEGVGSGSSNVGGFGTLVMRGAALAASQVLWIVALKYFGPVRTLLCSSFAPSALNTILRMFLKGQTSAAAGRARGAIVLGLSYLMLFFVEPVSTGEQRDTGSSYGNFLVNHSSYTRMAVSADGDNVSFGPFFSLPEANAGGIALFLSVILTMIHHNLAFARSDGSSPTSKGYVASNSAHAVRLVVIAVAFLLPIALWEWSFGAVSPSSAPPHPLSVSTAIYHPTTLLTFVAVGMTGTLVDHIGRGAAPRFASPRTAAMLGLTSAAVVAGTVERLTGLGSVSLFTAVCAVGVIWGMHMLFSKLPPGSLDSAALPVFGRGVDHISLASPDASLWVMIRAISLSQVLSGRDSRRIFVFLSLNLAFMFVEIIYGLLTNSLGLISDACHMLFDCTALLIGLYAAVISQWDANGTYTYGYGRFETLSGFTNGIFLVFIGFFVLLESAERFFHPQEISTDKLLLVSVLGLLVNIVGVVAFHDLHEGGGHSHSHDHGHSHGGEGGSANMKGVYLHVLADTLGSVGVIISSLLIEWFGWYAADSVCSFIISSLIFVSVVPLLKDSATTLLQTTPPEMISKIAKCRSEFLATPGVVAIDEEHFWRHNAESVVGTLHVRVLPTCNEEHVIQSAVKTFKKRGIRNLTVQITQAAG